MNKNTNIKHKVLYMNIKRKQPNHNPKETNQIKPNNQTLQ